MSCAALVMIFFDVLDEGGEAAGEGLAQDLGVEGFEVAADGGQKLGVGGPRGRGRLRLAPARVA
jgi:hypothetical protein